MISEQTRSLVRDFMKTEGNRDIQLLPGIIVGLQEDDNVADALASRNCFRKLRNICTHEPMTLLSQIFADENEGNSKLVFKTASEIEGRLVLDIPSFTAWMFEMFIKTNSVEYLAVWKVLMSKLYPSVAGEDYKGEHFSLAVTETRSLPDIFYELQNFEYKNFGMTKVFNKDDPYFAKLYNSNRKLYWRMAIPNLMSVVELFIKNIIVWTDRKNLNGYLQLIGEREGF